MAHLNFPMIRLNSMTAVPQFFLKPTLAAQYPSKQKPASNLALQAALFRYPEIFHIILNWFCRNSISLHARKTVPLNKWHYPFVGKIPLCISYHAVPLSGKIITDAAKSIIQHGYSSSEAYQFIFFHTIMGRLSCLSATT